MVPAARYHRDQASEVAFTIIKQATSAVIDPSLHDIFAAQRALADVALNTDRGREHGTAFRSLSDGTSLSPTQDGRLVL